MLRWHRLAFTLSSVCHHEDWLPWTRGKPPGRHVVPLRVGNLHTVDFVPLWSSGYIHVGVKIHYHHACQIRPPFIYPEEHKFEAQQRGTTFTNYSLIFLYDFLILFLPV